ncbi:MalY/PatB family protein [Jeotgalibaca caeni]|uniref:MalY/PatB family protein n=1 Tax=Jeotgalibaca caeni TaxID=3028623 RepID=UPI00237E297B|nr:MalY/PatB family protein [Jeotgalibaca caeni]MDE1548879.1 pyridoxal phosphate-dependent aminotransferase [Jeotgalibaca caeni]
MTYDFQTPVNRKNTGSAKWEQMYAWNPDVAADVIPLSVADMELKSPPEVTEGLRDYLNDAVLGYTIPYPAFQESVAAWQKNRHGWDIEPEWVVQTQGVVAAFYAAIRAFSSKGDGVLLFRPVYYPFGSAIADNERTEVNIPLLEQDGFYTIDFEAFETAAAKPENKILLFCSPHNPVGRVWTMEELARVAEIAVKHELLVISDEIWNDLVFKTNPHTVLATVTPALKPYLITCTSPSKTFNLAGMGISNIIIEDDSLRHQFSREVAQVRGDMIGPLSYKACELAYAKGAAWLDELLELVLTNQKLVHDFFKNNFPQIKAPISEGTYLQWIDFRALGMANEELEEFLHEEAQFFTDEGYIFGIDGSGFERINVALPTHLLQVQLDYLAAALRKKGC